jgi:diguanylate cyclase (GGDEF)-like protein
MNSGSKLNLNKLLLNHHKNTVLIPTFVIAVLLLIFYFSINTYMYNLIKSSSIDKVKTHGHDILLEKSKYIGHTLDEISRLSQILQKEHEHFFSNPKLTYLPFGMPTFEVAKNGVYYKTNKVGSSLYYSSDTKMTDEIKNKALRSEIMDVSLRNIVDSNPNIVSAYFNSWDNMNRIYPYIDNVYNLFGSNIKMTDYNFYYLADANNNPKKEPVWTGAYLDPAGNGWIVSCIVPIYNNGFLEGVSGIDITLESFINNILESKLPWSATLFMLDEEGSILAMPKKIEKIVKIKELIYHEYTSKIDRTIEKPEKYNLVKNKNTPLSYKFAEYYKNKTKIFELSINSIDYIFLQTTVKETGWRLILMIEKSSIFHSIYKLKYYADIIGYSAILFAIIFYLAFLRYTIKRSESFALSITNPIRELSRQTSFVGTDKITVPFVKSNIEEIDKLNTNFTKMTNELKIGKNNLVQTERRKKIYEEKAHIYHEKSLTDPLTGVYNRAKAEDVMTREMSLAKLYGQPLSLIMLDIDHFKEINDTLGHLVGDTVLVEFTRVITSNSRSSDIVTRSGGDEFVIICPNTQADASKVHAENIREYIQNANYTKGYKLTTSIGVTSYQIGDTREGICDRVDKALYGKRKR